jgi:quercetin dioxygenase-like cupin family protein
VGCAGPASGIASRPAEFIELFDLGQSEVCRRRVKWRMKEQPLIESSMAKIISLAGETQFAPNGIVSRTLVHTGNSRTVLFGFSEGQDLTEHTSTQDALIQILSGECEFCLDGKWQTLKAGTLLAMPPNLRHAVKAKQPFSMLLTLTKSAEPKETPTGKSAEPC